MSIPKATDVIGQAEGAPALAGDGVAASVVVSPDGSTVFVTGPSNEGLNSYDYLTIAYSA